MVEYDQKLKISMGQGSRCTARTTVVEQISGMIVGLTIKAFKLPKM